MSISIKKCNGLNRQKVQCNSLNLLEFTSKLCLELILILPLIQDNLSTMDKQLVPKVSSIWRFHCNKFIFNNIFQSFQSFSYYTSVVADASQGQALALFQFTLVQLYQNTHCPLPPPAASQTPPPPPAVSKTPPPPPAASQGSSP